MYGWFKSSYKVASLLSCCCRPGSQNSSMPRNCFLQSPWLNLKDESSILNFSFQTFSYIFFLSIRNLSAAGGAEACELMVKNDIMTSIGCALKKVLESIILLFLFGCLADWSIERDLILTHNFPQSGKDNSFFGL